MSLEPGTSLLVHRAPDHLLGGAISRHRARQSWSSRRFVALAATALVASGVAMGWTLRQTAVVADATQQDSNHK